jgi:hypothetical protein
MVKLNRFSERLRRRRRHRLGGVHREGEGPEEVFVGAFWMVEEDFSGFFEFVSFELNSSANHQST